MRRYRTPARVQRTRDEPAIPVPSTRAGLSRQRHPSCQGVGARVVSNLLDWRRRSGHAAMIFEAVTGVARETPAALGWPSNGLRPDHSHRREWLERGLLSPKLVCSPRRIPFTGPQGEPVPSALPTAPAPVVIAIDPHKASWTAVAVDQRLQPLAAIPQADRPAGLSRSWSRDTTPNSAGRTVPLTADLVLCVSGRPRSSQ